MNDFLYILGAIIKFAGVLLLIAGCALAVQRWPGLLRPTRRKKNIALLETVRLSPRQALHLVKSGDQYLLLGATDQAINVLTPVDLTEEDVEVEAAEPLPQLDFQKVMGVMMSKMKGKEVLIPDSTERVLSSEG